MNLARNQQILEEGLLSTQAAALWTHFIRLCEIPRPSCHEDKAANYVLSMADEEGWQAWRDEVGNVLVRKPATRGYEDVAGMVLQGHLDMVPQKTQESHHDFLKDPLSLYLNDGWLSAQSTTLGADNGIGVAAALAILESKELVHGPLEAVFTINEEAGMDGAMGLKPDALEGDILLNLDTEEDGELYLGCAGGVDINAHFAFDREHPMENRQCLALMVSGLKGGHSGIDIGTARANANRLLARLLMPLMEIFNATLLEINGGTLRNAIARDASAVLAVHADKHAEATAFVQQKIHALREEWCSAEPGLSLALSPVASEQGGIPRQLAMSVLKSLLSCPHGVERMSYDLEGVVETSNNLAVIKSSDKRIDVQCLSRSLRDDSRDDHARAVAAVFELAGASCQVEGAYPAWTPEPDSPLLQRCTALWKELFDETAKTAVIHAGLECGILGSIYPRWQMISFGPTIRGAHSPDEKVHLASVDKFWLFLQQVVESHATRPIQT